MRQGVLMMMQPGTCRNEDLAPRHLQSLYDRTRPLHDPRKHEVSRADHFGTTIRTKVSVEIYPSATRATVVSA